MPDPRPGDTLIPPHWPGVPMAITQVGDGWVHLAAPSPGGPTWTVGTSLIRITPEPGMWLLVPKAGAVDG